MKSSQTIIFRLINLCLFSFFSGLFLTCLLFIFHYSPLIDWFFDGEKTTLVFFHNHHELRPTGGFMGSYALIKTNGPKILSWQTFDIYEGDRYSELSLTPPPGVADYLSGGQSWGLTDANWSSDWSISVSVIETMMRAAKTWPEPDLVVALNLQTIEKILALLGDIYLPDYHTTISGQNFATIARQNRSEWFIGSRQKQNFLQHAASQLRLRLSHTTLTEKFSLFKQIWSSLDAKEIQLLTSNTGSYLNLSSAKLTNSALFPETKLLLPPPTTTLENFTSTNQLLGVVKQPPFPSSSPSAFFLSHQNTNTTSFTEVDSFNNQSSLLSFISSPYQPSHLQRLFDKKGWSGRWPTPTISDQLPLIWSESNVSINKANRAITHSFQTNFDQKTQTFKVNATIFNRNSPTDQITTATIPPPTSGADINRRFYYADYQRLAYPLAFKLQHIDWRTIDLSSQSLSDWYSIPPESIDYQILFNQGNFWQEAGWLLTIPELHALELELIFTPN